MLDLKDQSRWRVSKGEDGETRILGKWGEIHNYEGDLLDVWVHAFKPIEKLEKRSERRAGWIERKGWKAKQHYDDGALFIRPFSDLGLACRFIKASKRRVVTEAMRAKGREMARNLWQNKRGDGLNGPKSESIPTDCTNGGLSHE